jgi:membrane protein implicated in regulation of membrane protease activity
VDIIQYFSDNHASLLFLIAGIAFVIELAVMGLSGFVLFFAIGCFITGILSYAGILSGWESEAFSVGVLSCTSALILWKPLRRFQSREIPIDTSSDLIGREVTCKTEINLSGGIVRHSGIDWQARLDPAGDRIVINSGDLCRIVKTDGTLLMIAAVSQS